MPTAQSCSLALLCFLLLLLLLRRDASFSSNAALDVLGRFNQTLADASFNRPLASMTWQSLPHSLRDEIANVQVSAQARLYYSNCSGVFRGRLNATDLAFARSAQSELLNQTAILLRRNRFSYNVSCTFTLNLEESKRTDLNITSVKMAAHVRAQSGSDIAVRLSGIGIRSHGGSILGIAREASLPIGLHEVAALASNVNEYAAIKSLFHDEYNEEMTRLRQSPTEMDAEETTTKLIKPINCTFLFWLELIPVSSGITSMQLQRLEAELQYPEGANVISPPPHSVNASLYSPDCYLMLQSLRPLYGLKDDIQIIRMNHLGVYFFVCAIAKLLATIYQTNLSVTQPAMSKLSWVNITLPAMIEGYSCLLYLSTAMASHATSLVYVAAAFIEFIALTLYHIRFANKVIRAQRTLTILGDVDHHYRRTILLFYTATFTIFPLLYYGFVNFRPLLVLIGFAFCSTILAQIFHTMREGLPTLTSVYTLIMSLVRLAIPAYIFLCPHNIVTLGEIDKSAPWMKMLISWILLQCAFLFVQSVVGPIWMIPRRFRPQRYEYNRLLSDVEYTRVNRADDCAICMSPISELLQNQHCDGYMTTPCYHVFHTDCLVQWLNVRLQCPTCRSVIPPI